MSVIHVHFNSFFSQDMNMLFVMLPILTFVIIYNHKSHNMKPLCNIFFFSKLKNLFSNKIIYKHYAQLKVQVIEFKHNCLYMQLL
jgi:hypothetical protein